MVQKCQLTGHSLLFNPFDKIKQSSMKYHKIQELKNDINLLKLLGAKDTPTVTDYSSYDSIRILEDKEIREGNFLDIASSQEGLSVDNEQDSET